jgi:hypothetical protein
MMCVHCIDKDALSSPIELLVKNRFPYFLNNLLTKQW